MGVKFRMKNIQKTYKPLKFVNNNLLLGDLSGLPDESFSETLMFIDAGFLSKLNLLHNLISTKIHNIMYLYT